MSLLSSGVPWGFGQSLNGFMNIVSKSGIFIFLFCLLSFFLSFFLSLSLSCSFFSVIFFSLFFLISRSPHFRNWFLLIVFFVVFEAVVDIILNYFIESHLDSDQRGDLVDLRLALVFGLLFLVLSCSFVIISYAIFPFILTVFRDEN